MTAKVINYGFPLPSRAFNVTNVQIQGTEKGADMGFKTTKTLVVTEVAYQSIAYMKIQTGDILLSFNGCSIQNKTHLTELYTKTSQSSPFSIDLVVSRPVVMLPLKPQYLPKGYELIAGSKYHLGVIYKIPGCELGVSLTVNQSKVFVTKTEEGTLAGMSLQIGDAIIAVEGQGVTTVAETTEALFKALEAKGFAAVTIEQTSQMQNKHLVREVLNSNQTESVPQKDVTVICTPEMKRFQTDTEVAKFLSTFLRRQNFDLPDSIIYYILKNPKSSKVYQKLIQCCKYFFIKNPILVFHCLQIDDDGWKICSNNCKNLLYHLKINNRIVSSSCKIWVAENLCIYSDNENVASDLISRFFRLDKGLRGRTYQILTDEQYSFYDVDPNPTEDNYADEIFTDSEEESSDDSDLSLQNNDAENSEEDEEKLDVSSLLGAPQNGISSSGNQNGTKPTMCEAIPPHGFEMPQNYGNDWEEERTENYEVFDGAPHNYDNDLEEDANEEH